MGVAMNSPGIRSTRTVGRTRAGSSRRRWGWRWTHLVYGVLGQPVEHGQVAVGGDGGGDDVGHVDEHELSAVGVVFGADS